MSALDEFVAHREHAAERVEALADVLDEVGHAAVPTLRAAAHRARTGQFVVLLLGCFSTGKSTLLNALLGRNLLPAKVNPCTAIRTEVHYGEQAAIEIHYADGRVEPLSVSDFAEAWQLRTADAEAAGEEATDRFGHVDRAVIRWPLPLLANGVVLLDTPGLDDDPARTARTMEALPQADAVILVLSATRFLSELERRTVRRDLLPLGLRNLFFPVTMVDLLDALTDRPEEALAQVRRRGHEVLGPLCLVDGEDRFEDRFFPLDARSALASRWSEGQPISDVTLWADSGMEAFENALTHFLVQERGHAQLSRLHAVAVQASQGLAQQAALDRATANQSLEELERRRQRLEPELVQLKAIADRVGRLVDDFIDRQQDLVWQDLRSFLAETERELPEALAGFDLGPMARLSLLTPSGRAQVEARLRTELDTWLEGRVATWQAGLRPTIEQSLRDLQAELAAEAANFDALVRDITQGFAGGLVRTPNTNATESDVGTVERWFSVAVGALMLSPGAVAAGWVDGYEGALKGAASRLGVRLAVFALGVLLGPVGWASLLLYAVSDVVLLGLTGGSQLRHLRAQVADRLRGSLVRQADASKEAIAEQVREGLAPLRTALVAAAAGEAAELEAAVKATTEARAEASASADERAARYERAMGAADTLVEELALLATGGSSHGDRASLGSVGV